MQVVLVMFKNDGSRRSFALHRDATVVGRREDCDVRIPLGEISRKHCRLIRDDAALRIEDLGSSNGTFVNGTRIQNAVLNAGDTVQIGSVVFVVQLDGVPADDEIAPGAGSKAAAGDTADTASQGEPTIIGNDPHGFDPSAILEGPNDSGAADALDSSALAHDIAADLERVNRSR